MAWNMQNWLEAQRMSSNDLNTFEYRNHALTDNQQLSSIVVPVPKNTNNQFGGPVYVNLG